MNTKKAQENLPESTPVYYSLILTRSYNIYIAYFAIFIICLVQMGYVKNCIPILFWIAASCIARKKVNTIPIRWNLLFYVCISVGWITYFIYCYGWNCGGTNFIMPLLLVSMFSIYDRLFNKIIFTIFLFFLRMALFFNCQLNAPVYSLNHEQMLILQIVNTLLSFIIMVLVCMTFSSNLQKAEKHLYLYNMELQQQAATDPLTTLYNRRRMEEILKNHIAANPSENFSIAIGDIDFFKRVNDTYGHNTGDLALIDTAQLLKDCFKSDFVARLGGDEFLVVITRDCTSEQVLDETQRFLEVLRSHFCNKKEFSIMTASAGVAVYTLRNGEKHNFENLMKCSDKALYMAKKSGKNMCCVYEWS